MSEDDDDHDYRGEDEEGKEFRRYGGGDYRNTDWKDAADEGVADRMTRYDGPHRSKSTWEKDWDEVKRIARKGKKALKKFKKPKRATKKAVSEAARTKVAKWINAEAKKAGGKSKEFLKEHHLYHPDLLKKIEHPGVWHAVEKFNSHLGHKLTREAKAFVHSRIVEAAEETFGEAARDLADELLKTKLPKNKAARYAAKAAALAALARMRKAAAKFATEYMEKRSAAAMEWFEEKTGVRVAEETFMDFFDTMTEIFASWGEMTHVVLRYASNKIVSILRKAGYEIEEAGWKTTLDEALAGNMEWETLAGLAGRKILQGLGYTINKGEALDKFLENPNLEHQFRMAFRRLTQKAEGAGKRALEKAWKRMAKYEEYAAEELEALEESEMAAMLAADAEVAIEMAPMVLL